MPVSKKPHQTSHDAVLSSDCLARHVGELLACVERSVTHLEMCGRFGRDILGFIVEETVVCKFESEDLKLFHVICMRSEQFVKLIG